MFTTSAHRSHAGVWGRAAALAVVVALGVAAWLLRGELNELRARMARLEEAQDGSASDVAARRARSETLEAQLAALELQLARVGAASTAEDTGDGDAAARLDRADEALTALQEDFARLQDELERLATGADRHSLVSTVDGVHAGPRVSSTLASQPGSLVGSSSEPGWSEAQSTGAPDTHTVGDLPTAWAPRAANGGLEWLELEYPVAVVPDAIRVHESCGPGAVTRIETWGEGGRRRTIWSGHDPATESNPVLEAPYLLADPVRFVRITLDTRLVDGWNEIDAVGLVVGDAVHWATAATASSSFARQTPAE